MRNVSSALLGLAAVLCSSTISPATAAGDAQAGRDLAQSWCSSCHIVDQSGRGPDTAPPFPAVAQRSREDRGWLRAWLAAPHPPMPNFNLSRQQIDDVVAYLDSMSPR
jgi:cytochrome c